MRANPETIVATLRDVFEQVSFMFLEEPIEDEPFPGPDGPVVLARIAYEGPWRGTLSLAAPKSMCAEIAANALGVDPDDSAAENIAFDALGELLNVCCGRLLTALAGEQPVFNLKLPVVEPIGLEQWMELLNDADCIRVLVDGQPILAKMMVA